jgi:hypothetical protein
MVAERETVAAQTLACIDRTRRRREAVFKVRHCLAGVVCLWRGLAEQPVECGVALAGPFEWGQTA